MPNITRRLDWPARLDALIAERRQRPFEWGAHDCCLFVCDAVEAITGHDPAADLRGYSTERAALRLVKQAGGVRALADARLGAAIPVLMAQVGDAGLIQFDGRESLALCGGGHWLAPGEQGLEVLPLGDALAAWRAC